MGGTYLHLLFCSNIIDNVWNGGPHNITCQRQSRSKQSKGKQTNYTQDNSKGERIAALGGIRTHDTLHTAYILTLTDHVRRNL